MIDDMEDDAPQAPMEEFTGLFKSPTGRALAQEAQVRLQDYLTRRDIADANSAAGEAFVNNLGEMRSNYMGMVQDDPSATHVALDLAHLGVASMVGSVPGADPKHLDTISEEMRRDIARHSVHTLAEKDEALARNMLETPQVRGLLEDERPELHGYISSQAMARAIDEKGAQKMAERMDEQRVHQTAWNYMAAMVDPDTGSIEHPPGWASKVMADQTLPPALKAQLFDTYGRLQENGDAVSSDPLALADLLSGVAGGHVAPAVILSRAGDDLKAADAVYLAKLAFDPGRAEQISATLDRGREALAAPENGPAGLRAYANFTDWTLSNARGGADLDPASKEYLLSGNRLQQFAPRASYNVEAAVQVPPQERTPLHEIFGGGKRE